MGRNYEANWQLWVYDDDDLFDPGRGRVLGWTLTLRVNPSNAFSPSLVRGRGRWGKLLLSLTAPNPGAFAIADASGATATNVGNSKKGRKRRSLIRGLSVRTEGRSLLPILPTAQAARRLKIGKAVKVGIAVTYTPEGGTAASQVVHGKLKAAPKGKGKGEN